MSSGRTLINRRQVGKYLYKYQGTPNNVTSPTSSPATSLPMPSPMLLLSPSHLSACNEEGDGEGNKSDGDCDEECDGDGGKSNGDSNDGASDKEGDGKGGKRDRDNDTEGDGEDGKGDGKGGKGDGNGDYGGRQLRGQWQE